MRWAPAHGLVLSEELRRMGEVRVLVPDIRVAVVPKDVLVVPHEWAAEPREEVREVGVHAPVRGEGEMQSVVPVVGQGDPGKLRGQQECPPMAMHEPRDGSEEGSHQQDYKGPAPWRRLGGLLHCHAPADRFFGEEALGKGPQVAREGVRLEAFPLEMCAVIAGIQELELRCCGIIHLVLGQDGAQLVKGDEQVMRVEERGAVAALRQGQGHGASRVLELG
mmetsp:Transcript_28091/g.82268  ORF Transcript_28091/g.82268 Transcript_28091/m.82268 type:complete len:221 (-) Transcript_28091:380-1042(-)